MRKTVMLFLAALTMILLPSCGQTNENTQEAVYVSITAEEAKKDHGQGNGLCDSGCADPGGV